MPQINHKDNISEQKRINIGFYVETSKWKKLRKKKIAENKKQGIHYVTKSIGSILERSVLEGRSIIDYNTITLSDKSKKKSKEVQLNTRMVFLLVY